MVGAPHRLSDIGFPASGIDVVVDRILAAVPPSNPRPVTRSALVALLTAAQSGGPVVAETFPPAQRLSTQCPPDTQNTFPSGSANVVHVKSPIW